MTLVNRVARMYDKSEKRPAQTHERNGRSRPARLARLTTRRYNLHRHHARAHISHYARTTHAPPILFLYMVPCPDSLSTLYINGFTYLLTLVQKAARSLPERTFARALHPARREQGEGREPL